jgi:hypothetical protein
LAEEDRLAGMPDSAPPKWMFNNIGAIRTNTERIIELLESPAAGVRNKSGDANGTAT